MRLAAICGTVFIVALVFLILAPRGARQASRQIVPLSTQWRDTVPLVRAIDSLSRRLAVTESTLAARRALAARPVYVPSPHALSTSDVLRRDSLTAADTELARLISRVENSPLPQSYRALGESPVLRDDPRVRVLLDSLADVERERDEFDAGGGVDPIFVALTARATAIGRSIQALAEERRGEMRTAIASIRVVPEAPRITVSVDTVEPRRRRDGAAARRDSAAARLSAAREENAQIDRRLREARAQANVLAPPIAILAAALVIGGMIGFAVTLLVEISDPRVSDLQEAERVTGARVIAVVRPRVIPPERARRKADRDLPPLIDPTSDAYRLVASHMSIAGSPGAIVTVTGDVPAVTATIAANIGAVSANETRTTLLIDVDLADRPIASVLRLRPADGIASVLEGRRDMAATAIQAPVGRDRWLDVVAAGGRSRRSITVREAETLSAETVRVARYYDLTLIVAPLAQANIVRVGSDVLICAHIAHSPVATLRSAVAALRHDGAQVIGIVLWNDDAPSLDPPWAIEQLFALGDRRPSDENVTAANR